MRDILLAAILFTAFPLILYRYQIGALVIGFVSFMYPQSLAYGFAFSIAWLDYLLIFTMASFIIAQGYKDYKHHYLMTYVIIFYLWVCLTTIFAINTEIAFDSWLKFSKILILAFVVFAMLNTEKRLLTFIKVMVISIGYYGIKGGLFTIVSGGGSHVLGPINSFFSDNNGMALVLVMTLPFMLFFITHADNIYQKYFVLFCSLCTGIAVLGTQSRTGFVALAVMFLYYSWLQKKLGKSLLLIIPIAFVGYFLMADTWSSRMATTADLETDGSFQSRVEMWDASIKIANDHPIMGGGFNVIYVPEVIAEYIPLGTTSRAIHSAYFQMMAEHGYVGLGLFLFMILLIFQGAWKLTKYSKHHPNFPWLADLSIAVRSSVAGYLVLAITANIAFFDMLYFHITILALALIIVERERSTTSVNKSSI